MTAAFIWRRARQDVRRHPGNAAALVLAFATLSAFAGLAVLAHRAEDRVFPSLQRNVAVIAYLRDDAPADRVLALTALLRRIPGVTGVKLTSSDEAMARLRSEGRRLGGKPLLLDGVEPGFLPRSLELTLAPSPNLEALAGQLGGRLARFNVVAAVDTMSDGLDRLAAWLIFLRWSCRIALFLAIATAVAILAWAVGRSRRSRTQQVDALLFLGETPTGIRWPAQIIGSACGLCGAIFGLATVVIVFRTWLPTLAADFAPALGVMPTTPSLAIAECALGVALAAMVGLATGSLTVPIPRHARA